MRVLTKLAWYIYIYMTRPAHYRYKCGPSPTPLTKGQILNLVRVLSAKTPTPIKHSPISQQPRSITIPMLNKARRRMAIGKKRYIVVLRWISLSRASCPILLGGLQHPLGKSPAIPTPTRNWDEHGEDSTPKSSGQHTQIKRTTPNNRQHTQIKRTAHSNQEQTK